MHASRLLASASGPYLSPMILLTYHVSLNMLLEEKQGMPGVLGSDALFDSCMGDADRALLTS